MLQNCICCFSLDFCVWVPDQKLYMPDVLGVHWVFFVLFRTEQDVVSFCSLFNFLEKNVKLHIKMKSWSLFFQSLELFSFTLVICNTNFCENLLMCSVYCYISVQVLKQLTCMFAFLAGVLSCSVNLQVDYLCDIIIDT